MMKSANKQRVIVYIDGYNLYYGLLSKFRGKYKWLDLQAFSESFLQTGMELVAVKYFTAITKSTASAKQRQEIYLSALQAHCDKLAIYYGRFQRKTKQCRHCGEQHLGYEEKKTDVSIACEILNDTHLDRYDRCYLVSGDSDLAPPLKIIRKHHQNKQTIVAHPPHRKSWELCQIANGWFAISEKKFKNNQLPAKVTSIKSGKELFQPHEWSKN